jgi:hemerythrin superfamily protein
MFGFATSDTKNAIDILKQDHEEVDGLFKDFEAAKDEGASSTKQALASHICSALSVHATIEEELFYPAIRGIDEDLDDLVNEAAVEHQSLKDIIGRLEAAPLSDPLYDAGVKVLSEFVKHHVKEEENEIFPKVRRSSIDLEQLGGRMLARKAELEKGNGTAPSAKAPRGRARNKAHESARSS